MPSSISKSRNIRLSLGAALAFGVGMATLPAFAQQAGQQPGGPAVQQRLQAPSGPAQGGPAGPETTAPAPALQGGPAPQVVTGPANPGDSPVRDAVAQAPQGAGEQIPTDAPADAAPAPQADPAAQPVLQGRERIVEGRKVIVGEPAAKRYVTAPAYAYQPAPRYYAPQPYAHHGSRGYAVHGHGYGYGYGAPVHHHHRQYGYGYGNAYGYAPSHGHSHGGYGYRH